MTELTKEQTAYCPHLIDAGSYYAPLPWSNCKLNNQPIYDHIVGGKQVPIDNYVMCAYDAGEKCPYGY